MRWDADELPAGVLEQRLARLRTAMQRERLDAFLIYTNLVRPSAVNWVTGFTPYWSEGALLVFTDGAPVFATALSKRVSTWIKSTNPLSDIVNSPRPGQALGARIKAAGAKRVGLLELDLMPTALYDDLVAAVPEVSLTDASAVFADARRRIDDAERALLTRADAIARDKSTPRRRPMPESSRVQWSRTRGLPARKKPISRSRQISARISGSSASRSPRRLAKVSPFARQLPTRDAGFAVPAHSRAATRTRSNAPTHGSTALLARSIPASRSPTNSRHPRARSAR
jgi:hypothetical protein